MKSGDIGGLLEFLQRMHSEDLNLSYATQVDLDDLITNIIWANGRMNLDYEYFGDVVCFDTTYKKIKKVGRLHCWLVKIIINKLSSLVLHCYMMKHLRLSFGCLILQKVMFGKKSQIILTDQDAAMAKALASQWQETHHCLVVVYMTMTMKMIF